jgi:hypothetical protein
LWSGANKTGTKVDTGSATRACVTVSSLGLPQAASVVNNSEFTAITLYSDANCANPTSPKFVDPGGNYAANISPAAKSVKFVPLPS